MGNSILCNLLCSAHVIAHLLLKYCKLYAIINLNSLCGLQFSVVLRLYIMFSDREILHISSQLWFGGNWPIRRREIPVCWIDTCADGVCCWLTHLSWSGWPCCVCVVMSEVTFTSSSLTRRLDHAPSVTFIFASLSMADLTPGKKSLIYIYYILDFPEICMHKLQQPMKMDI